MKVVKHRFVAPDGVHVGVKALALIEVVLAQRPALPLGQRLHNLALRAVHGGNIKGDRALDAVQVIVETGVGAHEQRRGHALEIQRRAQILLKAAKPQLYQDRACQHKNHGNGNSHGFRVNDFLHRAFCQLNADDKDHRRHCQPGQILVPGMTVGMILVRRFFRQTEADQGHYGACGIGQVIHSVCRDGNRAGQDAHQQLHGKQKYIANDSNNAGQLSRDSTGFR